MAKRILFVDDEPMVLTGLKRSLHPMRAEWEMVFAAGGDEALAAIDRQTFDIIVTDMRMPGMDGAQLLEEVQRRSPQTLRMVLSGQSDGKPFCARSIPLISLFPSLAKAKS